MSLKGFHVVLISLSSLLAFLFGGWSIHAWRAGEGTGQLVTGAVSIGVGIGLIFYVAWFIRKVRTKEEEERRRRKIIRPLVVPVLLWLMSVRPVDACSVCYGEADGPMVDAARMGVYLLFGLVLLVQLAFVLFFIQLRRRARDHARIAGSGG